MIFHSCLGLFFIACLGWCLRYFIPAQDYFSLPAWGNVLDFHSCPELFFIACLGQCFRYDILFLPRIMFYCLPGVMFTIFHSCPGLFFFAYLGQCFRYDISFLPRIIFHYLSSLMFYIRKLLFYIIELNCVLTVENRTISQIRPCGKLNGLN